MPRGFIMLVFGRHQTESLVLVTGLEGGLLLGEEVFAVVGTPATAEHTVRCFMSLFIL